MTIKLNHPCAFISDLHIDNDQSHKIGLLEKLIEQQKIHSLFILGDLFDFWVGDEQMIHYPNTIKVLQQMTDLIQGFFIVGNRDFLLGKQFFEQTKLTKLDDSQILNIFGHKYHISHGDLFCTLDDEYQKMRSLFRNEDWQKQFLSKNLAEKIRLAKQIRLVSQTDNQQKEEVIMDVNPITVNDTFEQFQCSIIHGHTHRKNIHINTDNSYQRIVLGDWSEKTGNAYLIKENKNQFVTIN